MTKFKILQLPRFSVYSVLILMLFSCGGNESTSDKTTKDTSSQKGVTSSDTTARRISYEMPIYHTSVLKLKDLVKKKYKKVIFYTGFEDITAPNTVKLYVYPAKDLKADGTGESPVNFDLFDRKATITGNTFIFINTHVNLTKVIVKAEEHRGINHIKFIPYKITEGRYLNYFVYKIVGYQLNNLNFDDVDLGYSNPSPPAPPGGGDLQ